MEKKMQERSPWFWVPSLYYAEGIPYFVVMYVSVVLYKRLGISNTDIAIYTSWLYLPWFLKPLWSPIVDLLKTKRIWLTTMQLIIGAALGSVALTIPLPNFFKFTLGFFWLMAFSSATHDIAADGFYMLGLSEHKQAWFVGIRNTFYRLAGISGQGLLLIFAGFIESSTGLGEVNLNVTAIPNQASIQFVPPDSLHPQTSDGKLHLLAHPERLEIPIIPLSNSQVDSIIDFARNWNVEQGHVAQEKQSDQMGKLETEPSWWQRTVAQNLKNFLQRHFGKDKSKIIHEKAGNIGIVYFYLSQEMQKGKEVVVTFGRYSGDKSIELKEGDRFIFNNSNWNKPAIAVIQLDDQLDAMTSAQFKAKSGNIPLAWSISFFVLGALFVFFFIYHRFILPYPEADKSTSVTKSGDFFKQYFETFILFFKNNRIGIIIAFLLLYRLGESQIVKLITPFLLDPQEAGGLGLTTGMVGFVYGGVGLTSLIFGGLLGGFLAAKHGLKFWLLPMAIAINVPDAVYVFLSYALPDNFFVINICIAIEQFGYGFGFTAYTLFMLFVSAGEHKTVHFAIATAFMALGMMIPGMVSGWLQEIIGYQHFFIWVLIATIPGFLILPFLPLDKNFGKKLNDKKI